MPDSQDSFIIGITGHRKLPYEQLPALTEKIRAFYKATAQRHTTKSITVLSPLAEGADTLCAKLALDAGLRLVAPLPMPVAEYRSDFTLSAAVEFDRLLSLASEVFVVSPNEPVVPSCEFTVPPNEPVVPSSYEFAIPPNEPVVPPCKPSPTQTIMDMSTGTGANQKNRVYTKTTRGTEAGKGAVGRSVGGDRGFCYRQAGIYVARHCDMLLAVWDGVKKNTQDGAGTWETIKLAQEEGTPLHHVIVPL
ncbi:MAG: hypothetical protein LBC35_04025 [Coriobacteriales bacterium]|jgi:hypothetical protein|nr:hypothetical protein [Coriobacteriales bacterium]